MPRCGIIRLEHPKAMDAVVVGILSSFRSIDYGSCLFLPWSLNFFLPYVTPNLNFVPYLAVPSISTLHGVKLDVNRPFHPFEVCNARPSFSPVPSTILNCQRMLCKPPSYANYGNSNMDHWIKFFFVCNVCDV